MPVTQPRIHPFQDRKALYQFLSVIQQKSLNQNQFQIASIAIEIDPVDPLVVLQEMARPGEPHFYFEKAGEAIAAIGSANSFETTGSQRFQKVQSYLQSCQENLVVAPALEPQFTTPRWFCSFTFFDQNDQPGDPFAPASVVLPRWQISVSRDPDGERSNTRSFVVANVTLHPICSVEALTEEIWHQFQAICLARYGIVQLPQDWKPYLNAWKISDQHNFRSSVRCALQAIRQQRLKKLVLAHCIDVVSPLPFEWIRSLHNLRQIHPDCTIFSIGNGRGKSFIGASPERLLQVQNHYLETDALAGSAPRGKTTPEDADLAHRLLSSPKERHEHQVVVDFIGDRLTQLGITPQFPPTPALLQLSNIQHLHTPIKTTLPTALHPLEILEKLHPTPAVSGLPQAIAREEIRRYEPFGRSLYAAPLGWVDLQNNAEFIVGIRSALLDGHRARLYAGAGIVAGSDPDREFAEVRLKLQALLRALV
jgi:menaquinone-specific isochorismate synthase